ncbi:MAG: tRNA (guanosine(37)-N1)-methyltransferase TrmD [Candidatus Caenarcaniphilales bacterium]|nr:tRNA (guanosine(37)-N1)-methyltransferase TrmD [Candidatus Caenarcaniphilales bacterium]
MQFDVISLFPELVENYCSMGILGRAFSEKRVCLNTIQLRDFGIGKYKKVDNEIYGGGVGMLLRPEPIFAAHRSVKKLPKCKTILLSPSGQTLTQPFIREELLPQEQLIILCGRYEGFDERVMSIVDHKLSIGNYVLTGGEIGAMIIIDSVTRLIEGVLPKGQLAHGMDSFADPEGELLEPPQYTRPEEFEGMKVPPVLLSGNHPEIENWRRQNSEKYGKKSLAEE